MKILSISSSCDDSCCAIINIKNNKINILADIRDNQYHLGQKFQGVMPTESSKEHMKQMDNILLRSIQRAKINIEDIDYIASEIGPGLIGSVIIGSTFGASIATLYNKPFIPVHHLEAHILSVRGIFPFLALIVSGGHTMIVKCIKFGKYQTICNSIDDACGELFDKLGREINLPFPAGAHIEKLANKNFTDSLSISIPNKLQYSFSGLKTSLKNKIHHYSREDFCALIQNTIFNNLQYKLLKVIQQENIKDIVVCGGVAANQTLQNRLKKLNIKLYTPNKKLQLATDNAIMTAMAAYMHIKHQSNLIDNYQIEEFSRMSLEKWCNYF